jgi:uncharacterized membrane protein
MKEQTKGTEIRLWSTQGALAALFLFAGAMKVVMPLDALKLPLPLACLRLVGVAEMLGALGLILPGLVNVARALTPIAATGLVMIMAGATTVTAAGGATALALVPFLVGILAITGSRRSTRKAASGEPR